MRIGLLSDSPTLPTGFARTTRTLIASLADAGHNVVCFGLGETGASRDVANLSCRIWTPGSGELLGEFFQFLQNERPDILVVNLDLIRCLVWLQQMSESWIADRIACHLVVEGLPVDPLFLKPLASLRGLIVPTKSLATAVEPYVRCPVHYFPHLVDTTVFYPRAPALGIERPFVIGCIARNHPRKQLQQVLIAVQTFRAEGFPCRLRLHTDRIDGTSSGGDDLRRIAGYLNISDVVDFSESWCVAREAPPSSNAVAEFVRDSDCMAVVPTCGGFEYGIIEAQACGVPVITTDDKGVMVEVSGRAAYLVPPTPYGFTPYGAQRFYASGAEIARAVRTLANDHGTRLALAELGLKNVARYQLAARKHEFASILARIFSEEHTYGQHRQVT